MNFPETGTAESEKPFLKIKDKESVRVILKGDPLIFHTHWVGQGTVLCEGRDHCDLCKKGEKNTFRFRLNAYVNENGAYVAKVYEQGWTVYGQLKALNADYDLEKTIIKITRSGAGKNDTTYSLVPIPNGTVSTELKAKLDKVPLVDLDPSADSKKAPVSEPISNGHVSHENDQSGMFTEEDIPF